MEKPKLPEFKVGSAVTAEDIDVFAHIKEIEDRSVRNTIILNTWQTQQSEERKLRKTFAWGFLILLFLQVLFMGVVLLLLGNGTILLEKWVVNTFIISVFTEITGMTWVILRYLFDNDHKNVLTLLSKIRTNEEDGPNDFD